MRAGLAATQPSAWVKVRTADWKAVHVIKGLVRYCVTVALKGWEPMS